MKSKTSYSNVSAALIKEDFRKYWPVPVLAFAGYFLSGILYLLVNYKTLSSEKAYEMYHYIQTIVQGQYLPYTAIMIFVPILSALIVFRYLQDSGSVMTVHSQPFRRRTLINSHAISCALFSILPIIATSIIMLIFSRPVFAPEAFQNDQAYNSGMQIPEGAVNIFSRSEILMWTWESVLISVFVLAVCLIAAMITGTSFHQAVASAGFNAVIPVCLMMLETYLDTYLYGYSDSSLLEKMMINSTPVAVAYSDAHFSVMQNIFFIAATILMYLLAMMLYRKRKLERVTDGVVFKSADVIITFIFGYIGMTLMGILFRSFFEGKQLAATAGYFLGAVLAIIICRMIIEKSIKIISRENLKILLCYIAAAAAFICILNFDLFGYEKKIPEKYDSVGIQVMGAASMSIDGEGNMIMLSGDEAKGYAEAIHRYIFEHEKELEEELEHSRGIREYPDMIEEFSYVSFDYFENSADNRAPAEVRSYTVPDSVIFDIPSYRNLIESEEYRKNMISYFGNGDDIIEIVIGSDTENPAVKTIVPGSGDGKELIAAIHKDIENADFDDFLSTYRKNSNFTKKLEILRKPEKTKISEAPDIKMHDIDNEYQVRQVLPLYDIYPATLQWLRDNGFENVVTEFSSNIDFATVQSTESFYSGQNGYEYREKPQDSPELRVVTDKKAIESLYRKSCGHEVYGNIDAVKAAGNGLKVVNFYNKNGNSYNVVISLIAKTDALPEAKMK